MILYFTQKALKSPPKLLEFSKVTGYKINIQESVVFYTLIMNYWKEKVKNQSHLKSHPRTSLVVQWLRLCTAVAEGMGLIPDWGTKILHLAWCGQKKLNKKKIKSHLKE